jgi:hypothetical protein
VCANLPAWNCPGTTTRLQDAWSDVAFDILHAHVGLVLTTAGPAPPSTFITGQKDCTWERQGDHQHIGTAFHVHAGRDVRSPQCQCPTRAQRC